MKKYIYKTIEGDALDYICFKHYGFIEGVIEMILAENPHIHYLGYVFQEGVEIVLPDIRIEKKAEKITLW